jgi:adenylosuccinate lyase
MIQRYEVKEISKIWSEEVRFKKMLEVEIALLRALEKKGMVDAGTADAFKNVSIKPDRVREIEAVTRHDVIAFCTSITEQVDAKYARYFHFGVTSSDVLDTALSLQLRDSVEIIIQDFKTLIKALDQKIQETKDLLAMGRSHGMAAEPMVFAQKFLGSRMELVRRLRDYQHILTSELSGQISGAVGNYTVLSPEIEAMTLKNLNLPIEPVTTQVIPRDHLGLIVSIGALTASALERLAVELRHLHHSDISEVHEGFKAGQKGSSTMPHKKNPISGENITGLARVIRSHVEIAMENIVLWHERDISHSSTERLYLPDHFGLLSYSLKRMAQTISDLEVHREHIEEKVQKNFSTLSSLILHRLIEQNTVNREVLYPIVQAAAFQSKSLDEMTTFIKTKIDEQKLKGDLSSLNWAQIRKNYIQNFETVLKRSTEGEKL